MRRLRLFLVLALFLAAAFALNRLTSGWVYVIPTTPGEVAYVAAFDGFTEDWQQYQGVLAAQIMETGALRIEADEPNSGPFSVARQHFDDFDLRVQATPREGPFDNGYGVIFRLQSNGNTDFTDDSYYWFLVSSDGHYQVMRVLNGQQKRLSDWIRSPVVQPGLNVTNTLRVVADGDTFRFYINGQPVQLCLPNDAANESTYTALGECLDGQMADSLVDDSLASGQVGVMAQAFDEPGVVVDFDNLVIFGPPES